MQHRDRFLACLILVLCSVRVFGQDVDSTRFLSFVAEPSDIKFYWKDDQGQVIGSLQNLKSLVGSKNQELRFAMNGGMYQKDSTPQGLFVENGKMLASIDTLSGSGNFYLKPNGVFYLTKDKADVCESTKYLPRKDVQFATQSGPMLIIDGKIHPAFIKGSANLNIRNGVGLLPGNKVLFVMSKVAVNFYDFASYFKSMGCENALYLDGFVSRTYLPEKNWTQLDGNFGVIIGVTK